MMSNRITRRQQMNILYSHLMCWMQVSKEFHSLSTGSTTLKLLWSVSVPPGRGFRVLLGPISFHPRSRQWATWWDRNSCWRPFFDTLKMTPGGCCLLQQDKALLQAEGVHGSIGQRCFGRKRAISHHISIDNTTNETICVPLYRVAQKGQQPGQVFCPTRLKMHPQGDVYL